MLKRAAYDLEKEPRSKYLCCFLDAEFQFEDFQAMSNLPCKKQGKGQPRATDCGFGGYINEFIWDVEAECRRRCEQCEK